jgi:mono/diheme cytochrome c family protein
VITSRVLRRSLWFSLAVLAWFTMTPGCSRGPQISPETKQLYQQRCAMCHGAGGQGDGPSGVTLATRPRDWTDRAWQRTASDTEIRQAILEGGLGVGRSAGMPSFPDLNGKPEIDDLVRLVRSRGR